MKELGEKTHQLVIFNSLLMFGWRVGRWEKPSMRRWIEKVVTCALTTQTCPPFLFLLPFDSFLSFSLGFLLDIIFTDNSHPIIPLSLSIKNCPSTSVFHHLRMLSTDYIFQTACSLCCPFYFHWVFLDKFFREALTSLSSLKYYNIILKIYYVMEGGIERNYLYTLWYYVFQVAVM